MVTPLKEDKKSTVKKVTKKKTKKKVTKKKTKKKVVKKAAEKVVENVDEETEVKMASVLDVRINSEFLKEIIQMKAAFGLPDEATVVFRGLALLREVIRRKELGYDLCFIERKTNKVVSVDFGVAEDAGGA
jgi:hypothetical protein